MANEQEFVTQLAQHRTELAIERTHLAWVRTSFALITAAVAINRAISTDVLNTDSLPVYWRLSGIYGGIALALVASSSLFIASLQAVKQRRMVLNDNKSSQNSPWPSFLLAFSIIFVGFLASFLMMIDAIRVSDLSK